MSNALESNAPEPIRPRRIRDRAWFEQAIRDGWVREPNAPDPDEGADYRAATVIGVPVATVRQEN